MSDNVVLDVGVGGSVIAADDIGGAKYQRIKFIQGIAGENDGDVSSTVPLNVTFTNAALTSAVHAIAVSIGSSAMSAGLVVTTPKFTTINASNTDNTVVAAVLGKKIRLLAAVLVGNTAAGLVRFEDGTGGEALTGEMPMGNNINGVQAREGILVMPFSPVGWFETSEGVLLNLECPNSNIDITGFLVYAEVA